MHDYRILVGAAGWQHAAWQEDFYPEGLPDEWTLGFYGNEFKVILLPAVAWPIDVRAVQRLVQDSGESLAFLCELPLARCRRELLANNQQVLQAFGPRLLGVILPLAGVTALPELAGELAQSHRVCIDAGFTVNQLEAILQQDERLGVCWHGTSDNQELRHGRLTCARIRSEGMTLRNLRNILERLLAVQDPQRYLAVIFEGDPPSIEVMRQAMMLLDLL